jgi:hypothetical protein
MARYATAECADCHIRLPKNEMHEHYEYYTPGSARMYFRIPRRGLYRFTGFSVPATTRRKSIWLCDDCDQKRVDAEVDAEVEGRLRARRFWRNVLLYGGPLALIIFAYYYYFA